MALADADVGGILEQPNLRHPGLQYPKTQELSSTPLFECSVMTGKLGRSVTVQLSLHRKDFNGPSDDAISERLKKATVLQEAHAFRSCGMQWSLSPKP